MTPAMITPPCPRSAGRGRRVACVLLGVIGFIALCAIAMSIVLGWNIGVQATVIGLAAAILPVPVLVACFLWLDRYEPEPVEYLLLSAFAWGAFVATLRRLAVNTGAAHLFADARACRTALVAVLVRAVHRGDDEGARPAAAVLCCSAGEFSGIIDGIVYCGLSAVGFAMVENILYLGGHGYAAGAERVRPGRRRAERDR